MNKEILEMLCNDDSFKAESAEELRRELDIELSKSEPDIALVDELVKSVMEAEGVPQKNFDIGEEYRKIAARRRKRIRLSPLKIIAAAACTVLLVGNLVSYKVYGKNFFSAIVTEFKHDLRFDFKNENDSSAIRNNEYDDFGIKLNVEEKGYYIEVPMYFPEGFEVAEYRSTPYLDQLLAEYKLQRGEEEITLGFMFYESEEKVKGFFIQDGEMKYEETTINGHNGYYAKGDSADWATYRFDNTVAVYCFCNMERSEIKKILRSIK